MVLEMMHILGGYPESPESAAQGFWGSQGVQSHVLSCPPGQIGTLQFSHMRSFSVGYKVMLATMTLGAIMHCCLQVDGSKEKPVPMQRPV